ncbi:hypothetical protein CHS0354_011047 [Potamilus streckersoni]|uniref:Uncharacterized protein n=1 Tax=Potamilus streckersoni TaxID=2493646 RepID=A0AAE0WG03_9BIVA|nr:hypothetical protein CHS0354_011047 [Potamilus streckersoni]
MTKYFIQTYPTMLHLVDNSKRTPADNSTHGGNVAVLSFLLESGIDPWCRISQNETLLHRACIDGQLEMTKYLVQKYPAILHEVNNCHGRPAHNAAHSGNVTILSYLIDCGTDPWCRTSDEETLLHIACISGHLEMTKYVVQSYPTMFNKLDNNKRTPAHKATYSSNISVLSYLIDSGTDLWRRTSEKETLLHRSCIIGQLEMTIFLDQTYPTMHLEVDKSIGTPVHNAAESDNIAEGQTLVHRACINECSMRWTTVFIKKNTPAHKAAEGGDVTILIYLIDQCIAPLCQTCQKETLLHRACIYGQLKLTKHLVRNYPKILSEVDNSNRIPAHNAAYSGNFYLLSYLIDHGIRPWCRPFMEETLFHIACIIGQLEITSYLVQTYPPMLCEKNNSKRTPANKAAENGNITITPIDHGTDLWCRTFEKETLLRRACNNGQLDMTKYLVNTYSTMNLEVDNSNTTAAHNAAKSENVDVLR